MKRSKSRRRKASSKERVYRRASHIIWRRVDDETVLLNSVTSEYYSLNTVAAEVWDGLEKRKTAATIVRTVAKKYGRPQPKVAKDVQELIGSLSKEGLVQAGKPS